jgi:glycerol kinase
MIPAFQGLGTPYLDSAARAAIGGLSRASTRAHVVRAALEGIAWRCREVYDALRADSAHPAPATLRADGGAARNDVLLQLQADALGIPVERPAVVQAGALGAGYLAGLATGVWANPAELASAWRRDRLFEPRLGDCGARGALRRLAIARCCDTTDKSLTHAGATAPVPRAFRRDDAVAPALQRLARGGRTCGGRWSSRARCSRSYASRTRRRSSA